MILTGDLRCFLGYFQGLYLFSGYPIRSLSARAGLTICYVFVRCHRSLVLTIYRVILIRRWYRFVRMQDAIMQARTLAIAALVARMVCISSLVFLRSQGLSYCVYSIQTGFLAILASSYAIGASLDLYTIFTCIFRIALSLMCGDFVYLYVRVSCGDLSSRYLDDFRAVASAFCCYDQSTGSIAGGMGILCVYLWYLFVCGDASSIVCISSVYLMGNDQGFFAGDYSRYVDQSLFRFSYLGGTSSSEDVRVTGGRGFTSRFSVLGFGEEGRFRRFCTILCYRCRLFFIYQRVAFYSSVCGVCVFGTYYAFYYSYYVRYYIAAASGCGILASVGFSIVYLRIDRRLRYVLDFALLGSWCSELEDSCYGSRYYGSFYFRYYYVFCFYIRAGFGTRLLGGYYVFVGEYSQGSRL